MEFRFTIIDRNGVGTVIEDPEGWDKYVREINRDPNWHGVFFKNGGDQFAFRGDARRLLMAEYELYGTEGIMYLKIEEACKTKTGSSEVSLDTENGRQIASEVPVGLILETGGITDTPLFTELPQMKFDFLHYEEVCGDDCYVKVPVENQGNTMTLRNRYNQKVNLETLRGFDETTVLPPYARLPFSLTLPSKGILIQDILENKADNGTPVAGVAAATGDPDEFNSETGAIEIGMDTQSVLEIGNSGLNFQPLYQCINTSLGGGCNSFNRFPITGLPPIPYFEVAPLDITPLINYADGTPNFGQISDVIDLQIHLPASITYRTCTSASMAFFVATLRAGAVGDHEDHYIWHSRQVLYGAGTMAVAFNQVVDITASYSNPAFILLPGERVYVFYSGHHRIKNSNNTGHAFDINFGPDGYIRAKTLSHVAPTPAKVFMLNEAISRVAEAITNDEVRAYSEYYGRPDSQPYAQSAIGCGALKVLTDGLRIRRQENKVPGKTSIFSLSLQDLFDGLNPIDNIGMGLEPDPARDGRDRLRVENWEYFYSSDVIMSCIGISQIKRRAYDKEIYSTFEFGYGKWEAEEYNGLDEFLTKRNYRTMLQQVKNALQKLSKFVASGYALEITRRKGNADSKDWRYDKDPFIICCRRSIYAGATNGHPQFSIQDVEALPTWAVPGAVFHITSASDIPTGTLIPSLNGAYTILSAVYDATYNVAIITCTTNFVNTFTPYTFAGLFTVTEDTSSVTVELGNVDNNSNIVDPPTIYNWRIRPIANGMRWLNRVLESYKQFDPVNSKIVFTDGDGNYFAKGRMIDPTCRPEGAAIAENDPLNPNSFADPDDARPILAAERVEFNFPMSVAECAAIEANPKGQIYFESDCDSGYGYIDTIKYTPDTGEATFLLIPKITA